MGVKVVAASNMMKRLFESLSSCAPFQIKTSFCPSRYGPHNRKSCNLKDASAAGLGLNFRNHTKSRDGLTDGHPRD